jgi:hypothetical protein
MGGWGCPGFASKIALLAVGSDKHRNWNEKYRIFCSGPRVPEVFFGYL